MKKYVLINILFTIYINSLLAQNPTHTNCYNEKFFCQADSVAFNAGGGAIPCNPNPYILYYKFKVGPGQLSGIIICSTPGTIGYAIKGPFNSFFSNACDAISQPALIDTTVADYVSGCRNTYSDVGILPEGYYYLAVRPESCNSYVKLTPYEGDLVCPDTLDCVNCIGSYAPEKEKRYLVSAWVKEHGASASKTSYNYPEIYIEFPNIPQTIGPFTATGQIIDGWQRVEGVFTIPSAATILDIKLNCSTGDCYFDDIRVLPFDGSMKSYVYDPVNLRLVAELDERNYATFYEYDEEGKLMRIKKETEKGIMTIQESKTSVKKR